MKTSKFLVEVDESDDISTDEDEKQKKKKKKKTIEKTDIFGYLTDIDFEEETENSRKPKGETNWLKKNYLDINLSCKTQESSELFWKERRDTNPNIIRLLCRYRGVACTSIFEESCFSSINKIYTLDRTSLKDETVEAMMFCKKNWGYLNNK